MEKIYTSKDVYKVKGNINCLNHTEAITKVGNCTNYNAEIMKQLIERIEILEKEISELKK